MSDSPTEGKPEQEQGYRGVERRQGDRRVSERRVGERRVADRRRPVDTTAGPYGRKAQADAEARERERSRFWYDFMRFNLTGWSVVVPTLAGLAIGNWIDNRYPTSFSWALVLMAVGLFLGCLNAWYWIRHQDNNGRGK
ncbi:MAG: AtpZ/AtpI family protein [Actinobacteria bacterium]|nr:AtpZ/AtpI family protein [Actinomycetota bacterium]